MGNNVKNDKKSVVGIVGEDINLSDKIYEIRGEKVMLDFDLAKIYGYTTKAFNQQVKNNIKKFEGEEFMFRLTRAELNEISRSKNVTLKNDDGERGSFVRSNFLTSQVSDMEMTNFVRSQNVTSRMNNLFAGQDGGSRYLPHAFTEQGIYMLMTVLRGELATKQSRALVIAFKKMKDFIVENREALDYRNNLQMAMQIAQNTAGVKAVSEEVTRVENEMKSEFKKVNERVKDISRKMDEVVLKSDLSPILLNFSEAVERKEFLLLDGELAKADETYIDIYSWAKKSVYIIDNYINIKSLRHLQGIKNGVEVIVFSDNLGNYLRASDYVDLCKEFPEIRVRFIKINGKVHDRFIVLDYGTKTERMFHCGSSAKDAGARLTAISEWREESMAREVMDEVVQRMLDGEELKLK